MLNGWNLRGLFFFLCCLATTGCDSTSTHTTSSVQQEVQIDPLRDQRLVAEKPQEFELETSPNEEPVVEQTQEFAEPQSHTVRKIAIPELPQTIPQVLLAEAHAKLCRIRVGDSFPSANLPNLTGAATEFDSLQGKQGTVVVLWTSDTWMSHTALTDLEKGVVRNPGMQDIGLVGIAVGQSSSEARRFLAKVKVSFPQLLDTQGEFFSSVGSVALPRIFALDPEGKIVWFDIEYSEGTHRELQQTIKVLTSTE